MKNNGLKGKIVRTFLESGKEKLNISDIAKNFPMTPESTIRGRLNESVQKGELFERVGKGLYMLKGIKSNIGLIEGDARNPSKYFDEKSLDLIVSDFPWEDKKSHAGGNRKFASNYDCFTYESKDFKEKHFVLKDDTFLIEFLPERNGNNEELLNNISRLAKDANRLESFTKILNFIDKNDDTFKEEYKDKLLNQANYGEIDLMEKLEELKMIFKKENFISNEFKSLEKEMKKSDGFDFYVDVPITGGNNNTGRKSGFISVVRIFKKGNPKLKVFDEKLSKDIKEGKFRYLKDDKLRPDFKKVYSEVGEINDEALKMNFLKHINDAELPSFKRYHKVLTSMQDYYHKDKNGIELSGVEKKEYQELIEKEKGFYFAFNEYIEWLSDFESNYKAGSKSMFPEYYEAEKLAKKDKIHESQKPMNVVIDLLKQTSRSGSIAVELFAGSFRTGQAGIELEKKGLGERTIIGIEKDPSKIQDTKNYLLSIYKDIEFFTLDDFKEELDNYDDISNVNNKIINDSKFFINKINSELGDIISISYNDNFNINSDFKGDAESFRDSFKEGGKIIKGKKVILEMNMKRNSEGNKNYYLVINEDKNKFELMHENGTILNKNIEDGSIINQYLTDTYNSLYRKIVK